jgi:DnaJ-class molecular chaperone
MRIEECLSLFGLEKDANEEEIKKRFRNLAKEYHPDLNKNNKDANEDFIKLKEAYDILINYESQKDVDISKRTQKNYTSFFNLAIDDIFNFFKPTERSSSSHRIHRPEPFIDLKKIVRERDSRRRDF